MDRKHLAGFGAALLMLTTSHAALAATDQEFLKTVIGINLAEIEAGQMAQEKSQSDGVKDFGRMLVDDHTKANEEAKRLAATDNVTAPNEPSAEAQQEGKKLSGLSGAAFDREFVMHMAEGHKEAIALFKDKADDAASDVTTFAKDTLPDLERHLQTAETLMQEEHIASAPGAMTGAGTGKRPMVGAETGSHPLEGAETGKRPMIGAAPSPGAPNSTDKTGEAASPAVPGTGTAETTAQSQPAPSAAATPSATSRPDGLRPVDVASMSSDDLVGATVYGADDESVGEVSELIVSKNGSSGDIDAVVIDVGGFLGIGTKPVAISFKDLEIMTDGNGKYYVYSKFTRDQLDGAVEYDRSKFEQDRHRMILRSSG